jgi:hypothetical protein
MGRGIPTNEKRRKILGRDGNCCKACSIRIPVLLDLHHVIPVEFGGHDANNNLIAVCKNCHKLIHWFSSKARQNNAVQELLEFGFSKDVASKIERFSAAIIQAKGDGAAVGHVVLRDTEGVPTDLPMLAAATALCAKKNKLTIGETADFAAAVTKLIEHIPEAVASKSAFRLTHQEKSIGVNMMNYLLLRAPARPDVGRHKGATGVFVIAPSDSALASRYDVGFNFTGFPAVNVWCEYQDILGWKKADWQDFERGCEMAAAAPKSRSWLSNIAVGTSR